MTTTKRGSSKLSAEEEAKLDYLRTQYPANNLTHWFDLASIASDVKEMDLGQWYRQLVLTAIALNELSDNNLVTDSEKRELEALTLLDNAIRMLPVAYDQDEYSSPSGKSADNVRIFDAMLYLSSNAEHSSANSHPTVQAYLESFGRHITSLSSDKVDNKFMENSRFDESKEVDNFKNQTFNHEFDSSFPQAFIKVNLAHPDNVILADIKEMLVGARALSKQPKPKSKKIDQDHMTDWSKGMVLPFMYIWIWKLATKSNISYFKIGSMLFPDNLEFDPAEKIRKTVKPKAKYLRSWAHIRQIEAQLKIEQNYTE